MQNKYKTEEFSTENKKYSSFFLDLSVKIWFVFAMLGQWIFGIYVVSVYHVSAFKGNFEKWNTVLPKGYIAGDWKGNLLVGIHVLLAAIIVLGGPLQIIPKVRSLYPTFHRWLGRTYVFTAIIVSLVGLMMIWTRGTVGDTYMHVTNSIQAIYIVVAAILSIRYAQKKQFTNHRKWTLRLFLLANGVWFFRVGLMAWLVINQAPVGFNPDTFTGPFLWILSTICYAAPISILLLEMYFYAQMKQIQLFSTITAILILISTGIMIIGVFGATMGMWLPRI